MMKTTCIEKQRYKGGKIVKYIIKDLKSGQYFEFTPAELKSVISSGNMECDNLKLTKDNRLMDKKKPHQCKAEDAMWDTLSESSIGITGMSRANLRKFLQNRLGLPIKHLQTKMGGEYCCVGHLPMYIEILNDQYDGVYFECPLPVVEISNKYLEDFMYTAKSCNLTVYGDDLEQIDNVLAIYKQYALGDKVIAGFDGTERQTIIDLLRYDRDPQVTIEAIADWYFNHNESYNGLEIPEDIQELFKSYADDAIHYFDD